VCRCRDCGLVKQASEFKRDRSRISNGGFGSYCLECQRARDKVYYKRVRERKLARHLEKVLATKGPRMCAKGCGRKATSQKHIYCGACRQQAIDDKLQRRGKMSIWGLMLAREKEARRSERRRQLGLTSNARGYGRRHQVERERAKADVESGYAVCARCRLPLLPTQAWDLGHDDLDRSRYVGPEHRHAADCPRGGNRATSRHRKEREMAA
jgi:hypothetical protein